MSPLQGRYQFGLRTGNSASIHKIVDIRAKINQSRGFVVGNSQRIILPHFFQSVLELMNLPLTSYQALPHAEAATGRGMQFTAKGIATLLDRSL